MKKTILFILTVFSIYSCVNDSEDYREDSMKPYSVPAQYLFSQAEKSLADRITTPNVNRGFFRFLSQYWTETTYYNEAKYDFETRKIPQNFWNGMYLLVLGNLEEAKKIVIEEQPTVTATTAEIETFQKVRQNKLAQIELLQVYTYQLLVDAFGNIPYSEAGKALEIPTPKYDDAATIYTDLIKRTEKVLSQFDTSEAGFGIADFYYGGDILKWKKFGNSLLIKLGTSIADINPALASTTINKGFNEGAIIVNADNTLFKYDTASPNFSPLYEDLVVSGRKDFVAADTFIEVLNTLEDPRREKYFQLFEEKDKNGNVIKSYYKGGKYGNPKNTVNNASKIGTFAHTATTPGVLFDASEINFYLAEAVERGFIGGSAETYYNNAITLSFEYWEVPDIATYLAKPEVTYSSAPGTWKEKIGKQAWISLYNRLESWNTKRRLDYPVLKVSSYSVLTEVPVRLRYPIDERSVNTANYNQASSAIGGDKYDTKIFWDVN